MSAANQSRTRRRRTGRALTHSEKSAVMQAFRDGFIAGLDDIGTDKNIYSGWLAGAWDAGYGHAAQRLNAYVRANADWKPE